jgi:hypothetical protein
MKTGVPLAAFLALLLPAVVVGSSGCMSTVGPDKPQALAMQRLGPAGHSLTAFSGYSEPQGFVVHDSTTLLLVWSMIYRDFSPKPPIPSVDFTNQMIVVVALGRRPTGGYDILLDSATYGPSGVTVFFHSVGPDRSADVAQVVTQPADAGILQRVAGPIEFQDLTQ